MVDQNIITDLDEFAVKGNDLFHKGVRIASFETLIRELARVGDQLFVIVDPDRQKKGLDYAGTNFSSIDLSGNTLWVAPNLNREVGRGSFCYFQMRLFDQAAPKIHVIVDDHEHRYFDARTGARLLLDPKYDWKNYKVAWKQFTDDQDRITRSVFAPTRTFYPRFG
jgi:hypothetical protein